MLRRRILPLAFGLALTLGCGLESAGQMHDGGLDGALESGPPVGDDGGLPLDDATVDASSDAGFDAPIDVGPDVSCNPDACPGKRCLNGKCDFYATCDELHTNALQLGNGTYPLHSNKKNGEFDAYCNMSDEGGGWMLVGASVFNGSGNFGWKKSAGSLSNDSAPYSVNVDALGLAVNEVLIGVRGIGKGFLAAAAVYRIKPPANLMQMGNSAGPIVSSGRVAGLCTGTQAPTMFGNMGYVDRNDVFFFRDSTSISIVLGLKANGLDPYYDALNCNATGGLGNVASVLQQGLLFVK